MNVENWQQLMSTLEAEVDILAPYKIFKQGDKWVVKNNANMVKASFKSRDEAVKYLRALYANVGGAAKKADKTKWSGKAPKPKD